MERKSGKIVALKKYKNKSEGYKQSFCREVNALRQLKHENISDLKGIFKCQRDGSVYLVMDYYDFDLRGLMSSVTFTDSQILSISRQLLNAVICLNENRILHRDIKPENIFITKDGEVKLGDFGLALDEKKSDKEGKMNVSTPSYKAPELLLGNAKYTSSADMWSVGCVIYELITGKILFKPTSATDAAQLKKIVQILGKPDENEWREFSSLLNTTDFNFLNECESQIDEILERDIPDSLQPIRVLLSQIFQYNPSKRPSATEIVVRGLLPTEKATTKQLFDDSLFIDISEPNSRNTSIQMQPLVRPTMPFPLFA